MMATLGISIAVMRVRMRTTEKKRLFDPTAFKERPFLFFTLGSFSGFMGLYMLFFYMSDSALSTGSFSSTGSFYLLIILNSLSTFGGVLPNCMADKIGPLNVSTPWAGITAILA